MTQDLQQLLEKIQRDGVDKAQQEANQVLADAQTQAKAMADTAHAEADKMRAAAEKEAEAFTHRAEETIRQAARDTLLNVEKAVTALFERLLLNDVKDALKQHPERVTELATEAAKTYLSGQEGVEIAAAADLVEGLRAQLAAHAASSDGVTIVTDETTDTGFRVRLANGRIEHAFTGNAIAETLAKQLRPRLAALMKP